MLACNPKDEAIPQIESETTIVSAKTQSELKSAGEDLKVQLISVEDSRCPLNANCIWVGSANLKFKVSDGDADMEVHVVFSADKKISGTQEFKLDGQTYVLAVAEVLPYPETSKTPTLEDYQVKVSVEKK